MPELDSDARDDRLREARDLTRTMLGAAHRGDWPTVASLDHDRGHALQCAARSANPDAVKADPLAARASVASLLSELQTLDTELLAVANAARDRAGHDLRTARRAGQAGEAYRATATDTGSAAA